MDDSSTQTAKQTSDSAAPEPSASSTPGALAGTSYHPLYIPPPYQEAADHGRVILKDGTTAGIRTAEPGDIKEMDFFFQSLSPDSLLKRFFSEQGPDAKSLEEMCDSSDPTRHLTLVVTRIEGGTTHIVATASYIRSGEKSAEFAVSVMDKYQNRGLGQMLLERLCVIAAMHGFTKFEALTRYTNKPMLEVFRKSGFEINETSEEGYVTVDLSVRPSAESVKKFELRDRIYTASSMRPFFKPTGVAVVGASRKESSIGNRIMNALIDDGYTGEIFPINPKADEICGKKAYKRVQDVPETCELAVIAVPRTLVLDVIDDCAAGGVRVVVVISAGFSESDAEGKDLQAKLVDKVRGHGMRMVGPNCLGLLNADPEVKLNASFSPLFPPAGRIAMSSQSGALGLSILALARRMELGLSTFVSMGNKADVSGNDLLQYWETDANTDVILLYLESFKNPRRFARIARRVARSKPIICVKSGRTSAGQRAAGSHTAALAGSDVPVEALFQQTGVIRAETLEDMFDLAIALANQPLPQGKRVGIVTNAGGPGILCTDACEGRGMLVPEMSDEAKAAMREFLPPAASVTNPVDMIASATPEQFAKTIETVLCAEEVDAVITIYIPVGTSDDNDILQGICDGVEAGRKAGGAGKPVLVVPMLEEGQAPKLRAGEEVLPTYPFPEATAKVLNRMATYSEWRNAPVGMIPAFEDCDQQRGRSICRNAVANRGDGWLSAVETRDVLTSFGLPVPPGGVAKTADEAVAIAEEVGFPVAVKLASHTIVHKTEMQGVRLNLKNSEAVRNAFEGMRSRLAQDGREEEMEGVLIQPMVSGGVEVMIGVTEDPLFGPLIGFGLGGVFVEILKDVRFRVTPLTDQDAHNMVREIRGFRLLEGYRGHPPADIDMIEQILLRISLMVEELPEIEELDLNPIFAMEPGKGAAIVDARIRVRPTGDDAPTRIPISGG